MTEIIIEDIPNKGFCAIDNHRRKNGKDYTIIYRNKTKRTVEEYLNLKGL